MSEIALSGRVVRNWSTSWHPVLSVLVAAWFVVVLALGSNGFFVTPQGAPPLALLTAAGAPVILFLLAVSLSSRLREFALKANLKFATAIQAWRLGGYSFLVLYGYGYLPGYFAWPAGVGDMIIGATAPLVLAGMSNPGFVQSRTFVAWHLFGILDLVVAVGMGALGSLLLGGHGPVFPTTIMSQMPLVLIPAFFVPTFVVLHLVALMQAGRAAKIV